MRIEDSVVSNLKRVFVSGDAITKRHRLGVVNSGNTIYSEFRELKVQDQDASMVVFLGLFLLWRSDIPHHWASDMGI